MGQTPPPPPGERAQKPPPPNFAVDAVAVREGTAAWYEVPDHSLPERRAWEGEMTAASDSYPLNTYLRVRRLETENPPRTVIVRITDTGIYAKGTLIDLSREAGEALGMLKEGRVRVRVETLALQHASTDKPVEKKDSPAASKPGQAAASESQEKQAADAKTTP